MYMYIGKPSTGNLTFTEVCVSDAAISWDPVTSDPVCGPVSYDVTISPSDGVVMMRLTDTSYNFTRLTPDNSYAVTVAVGNDAGVVTHNVIVTTPAMQEALPNGNFICSVLCCTMQQLIGYLS